MCHNLASSSINNPINNPLNLLSSGTVKKNLSSTSSLFQFLVSSYFYISLPPDQYHSTVQCESDSWPTPAPQYLHERPDLWGWQFLQDQYQQQALAFISWGSGVAWFRRGPVWLCHPPCYSAGNGSQYVCHSHCGRKGGRSWTYHPLTLTRHQSGAQVSNQFNRRRSTVLCYLGYCVKVNLQVSDMVASNGHQYTDANKAKEKHWSLL